MAQLRGWWAEEGTVGEERGLAAVTRGAEVWPKVIAELPYFLIQFYH
jgi:hypothetical protein